MATWDTIAKANAEIYSRRVERTHQRGDFGSLFLDGKFVRRATRDDYAAHERAAVVALDPDALVHIEGIGLCELRESVPMPGRDD